MDTTPTEKAGNPAVNELPQKWRDLGRVADSHKFNYGPVYRSVAAELEAALADAPEAEQYNPAQHSATCLLEDVPMEKMAEVTGLPLGVIVAAYKNIFQGSGVPMPAAPTPPKP